jgi:hypothetical protein
MKNIAMILLLGFLAFVAQAADTTQVTLVIDGTRVEPSPAVCPQIVERSIDLLGGCAYMSEKPNWGAPNEPRSMADARKQSHLHLVFSSPRKIDAPIRKGTVQAREIVITLPLTTAGIWVRSDEGTAYFAKFRPAVADSLQKLLDETRKP